MDELCSQLFPEAGYSCLSTSVKAGESSLTKLRSTQEHLRSLGMKMDLSTQTGQILRMDVVARTGVDMQGRRSEQTLVVVPAIQELKIVTSDEEREVTVRMK